jgi:hypothetical protein
MKKKAETRAKRQTAVQLGNTLRSGGGNDLHSSVDAQSLMRMPSPRSNQWQQQRKQPSMSLGGPPPPPPTFFDQ